MTPPLVQLVIVRLSIRGEPAMGWQMTDILVPGSSLRISSELPPNPSKCSLVSYLKW